MIYLAMTSQTDRDNIARLQKESQKETRVLPTVRRKKWIGPRSIGFSEWFGQCRSKWHPRWRCENGVRCPVKEEGALCFWVYCFCPLASVCQHRASCMYFVSCTRELVWYHIVLKARSLVKVRCRQTQRGSAKISFGTTAQQGITKPSVID